MTSVVPDPVCAASRRPSGPPSFPSASSLSTKTQLYGFPSSCTAWIRCNALSTSGAPSTTQPQCPRDDIRPANAVGLSSTTRIRVPRNSSRPAIAASPDDVPVGRSATISRLKVVPRFSRLLTLIFPSISSTSCLQMARPRPVPPYFRVVVESACSNGTKIRPRFSGEIPMPVSCTSICRTRRPALSGSLARRTETPPAEVNFSALPIRLVSICRSLPGSPCISAGTSRVALQANSSPFSAARKAYRSARSSSKSGRLKSIASSVSFFASILEKSRMSLMIDNSDSELERMMSR